MKSRAQKSKSPQDLTNGLPANIDAERFVLGSLMLDARHIATVRSELQISDFILEKHRRIYRRMLDLAQRGEHIDRVTVAEELMRHHELESCDGLSYIVSLDDGLPQIANLDSYVRIVKEKAKLRYIIQCLDAQQKRAMLGIDTSDQLIASAAATFDQLSTHNGDFVLSEIPSSWKYEDTTTYLVQDLIVESAITMWTGESGDGKSTLALALGAAVAQGHPFLGRTTLQRSVLYMDRENPIAVVKDRLFRLGIPEIHDRLKIWGTWWKDHYPPGPAAAPIVAYAQHARPLIIWDSLIAFAECEENSSNEMRHHMKLYRSLAALGATILLIHHRSEKGEGDYRGSSDIRAVVDSGWRLSRDDNSGAGDALGRLLLRPYKTRTEPGKPIRIEYQHDAFLPLDGPPRPALDITRDLIRSYPGAMQKELKKLASRQGLGEHRLVETLEAGVLAGQIDARRGKHNTLRYYLPEKGLAVVV